MNFKPVLHCPRHPQLHNNRKLRRTFDNRVDRSYFDWVCFQCERDDSYNLLKQPHIGTLEIRWREYK